MNVFFDLVWIYPFWWSWDLITGILPDKSEVVGGFCWSKFVWTKVYMSSPMSVHSHWPFDHYFQSLCVFVFHVLWHHIKIVSWSFHMNIFVWSTFWSSLLILWMSWRETVSVLNSRPSWLWTCDSSPPPTPGHHCARCIQFFFVI